MFMDTGYVLDWYTSKYFVLKWLDKIILSNLKWWELIVYDMQSGDKTSLSVWTYLGYSIKTDREAVFNRVLEWRDKEYFDKQQEFALEKYKIFKKSFKAKFLGSSTVTARYHIYAHQLYFYFYSEDRYVFSDYVRWLREQVGCNIFLFQVGARDMVRLSHVAKNYLTIDGRPLHASWTCPLPSVSMENIWLQWLEWRDVERLRWWSGKLKESLSYETDLYLEESKRYPIKGSRVSSKVSSVSWICLSFNIQSWDVTVKTKEGGIYRLPVFQLEFDKRK